nr:UxaA family hydrolase [Stakelama flava]
MIVTAPIAAGDIVTVEGAPIPAATPIGIGHKVARRALDAGDKVLKYGAPIGSMTAAVNAGDHIHMHNMKSDYIPSHTRDAIDQRNGS